MVNYVGCGVYITVIETDYNFVLVLIQLRKGVYITVIETDYNVKATVALSASGVYITVIETDYNVAGDYFFGYEVFISLLLRQITTLQWPST